MIDTRIKDKKILGKQVKIATHPKSKPEEWKIGNVVQIIDDEDYNPKGTEVEISTGQTGNIKEIIEIDSEDSLRNRLTNREDHYIERKETFSFDVNENKKNKERNLDVVKAVVSFMNSDGGFVYIGVHDDGTIKGLERDYQCMEEGKRDNDQFERQIRQSLSKNLTNESIVADCTKNIKFPQFNGIEICEIQVKKSPEPIFFKKKNETRETSGKKKPWSYSDFYRREGNAKHQIITFEEFTNYYKIRFGKTLK